MKKLPWIIIVAVLGVLNIALLVVILLSPANSGQNVVRDYNSSIEEDETRSTKKKEDKEDPLKNKEKETTTEETETTTEPETTEAETKAPDWSDVGTPGSSDFNWVDNSGSITSQGEPINNVVNQSGRWKAEAVYYSASGEELARELLIIDIDLPAGTVTFTPYMILYSGDMEWFDESNDPSYTFSGDFAQDGTWNGQCEYGQLSLYSFCELDGSQYGGGLMTMPSGNTGQISLVRP